MLCRRSFSLRRVKLGPARRHKSDNYQFLGGSRVQEGDIEFSWNGLGHLSESSVLGRLQGTVVHAAVNSSSVDDVRDSFLPLTVDYRARQYAFGTVPEQKNRRERHNSEEETLVARVIDRVVRPLFPKGYVRDVQITVTTHAADGVNNPDVIAVNSVSCALLLSRQPFYQPVGCVRIGYIDGNLVVNPSVEAMLCSELDLVYAGTTSSTLMYSPFFR